jgi:hypothetical protein
MIESRTYRGHNQAGASLLGMVIVIAILGVLAMVASKAVTSPDLVIDPGSQPAPAEASTAPPSSPARPVSPATAAAVAACRLDERSVEDAATAMYASAGRYPTTIADLVAGRWLAAPPANTRYTLTLETVADRPTGRVLVNGNPGVAGCDALGGG